MLAHIILSSCALKNRTRLREGAISARCTALPAILLLDIRVAARQAHTIYAPDLCKRHIRLEPPLEHGPQGQPNHAHIAVEDNRAVADLREARMQLPSGASITDAILPCQELAAHMPGLQKHPLGRYTAMGCPTCWRNYFNASDL